VIHERAGLDAKELRGVQALVRECEEHDRASACIQMDHSLNFRQEMGSWFLCRERGELEGVGSIFAPAEQEAEVSLCVRPSARRSGLGTALLRAAEAELDRQGVATRLLVCDRASGPGCLMVSAMGLGLHHAEHTLAYDPRSPRPRAAGIEVREGTEADRDEIVRVTADAFGDSPAGTASFIRSSLAAARRRSWVGTLDGAIVASCFVGFEEGSASINTCAVPTREQGKGHMTELLYRVLDALVGRGTDILIDVDSLNERACGLYRKIGFREIRTVGYYLLLPLSARR
jgi:ribosomal protein S18 acetylase RimI-like enzyme